MKDQRVEVEDQRVEVKDQRVEVKDQRMEELSDLVRRGIPIDFIDTLSVIDYQELRRQTKIAKRYPLVSRFCDKLKNIVHFSVSKFCILS